MSDDGAPTGKEPTEASRRRATWAGLLLEGQNELRAELDIDEAGFLRVAGPSHGDRRGYLMYAVLDELLKTSACLLRWLDLLTEMETQEAAPERFWTESIVDEESLRIRKLVEALTDLICFRRTNEDAYYQHFLLLRDLNEARGTQEDLRVFYACPSLNVGARVDRLAGEVAHLESSGSVDLNAAWYLPPVAGPRSPQQLAGIRPGGYLASTRARLRAALPLADAPERLALGVSYDRLFTRVSRDIHFTPSARGRKEGVEAVSLGLDECGILGLHLLLAVLRLLGVEGGPQCQRVSRIFAENAYPGELSERVTRGTAKPGDFVLAYGDLGEVVEVAESEFGYVSYKVRYLVEKPLPGIPQDWFPAQTVRVLFSRQSLLARVSELVEAGALPDNIARRLTTEAGDAFRASVTELWDRALREYVLGREG